MMSCTVNVILLMKLLEWVKYGNTINVIILMKLLVRHNTFLY